MTATAAGSAAAEPPPELVERFREALARLWPEGGRLGLAVSGGPDSLAMLLLAEAAIPGQFEVATVDHGLRAESAAECAMVAQVCAARSVPCETLRIEVGAGNLQAEARRARYDALGRWASRRELAALATAHHADDQAETLLMRLNRGSGLAGLAGVREVGLVRQHGTTLVRPLLTFRRSELGEIVARSGLEPIRDPSNADERFERARIRRALTEADWIDPVALARSAALLGDAQRAIEAVTEDEWRGCVFREGGSYGYYPSYVSPYVEIEVVTNIITAMGGSISRSEAARLIDRLRRQQASNVGGVLVRPTTDQPPDAPGPLEKWVFTPEPPRSLH